MTCASSFCTPRAPQVGARPAQQQNLRAPAASRAAVAGQARRQLLCRAEVDADSAQVSCASFEEWDIVLYETRGGGAALGRVSQVDSSELQVERLEEDATNQVWIVHGPEERVPVAAVRRTLEADYLQMVDPDRISNPHGEHALEAYRLLEPAMAAAAMAAAASSSQQQAGSRGAAGSE